MERSSTWRTNLPSFVLLSGVERSHSVFLSGELLFHFPRAQLPLGIIFLIFLSGEWHCGFVRKSNPSSSLLRVRSVFASVFCPSVCSLYLSHELYMISKLHEWLLDFSAILRHVYDSYTPENLMSLSSWVFISHVERVRLVFLCGPFNI